MKKKLKILEKSVSLSDAERLSDELATFDDGYSLTDEEQQRILSSVMRKAGFEMNETIKMRKTERNDRSDNYNKHTAEVTKRRYGGAAAACFALVLVGAIGAGLFFRQGVEIDEPETQMSCTVAEPIADSGERKVMDWAKPYLEQNPETVGYLKIKGIRDNGDLDSPVVQHDDNSYYFYHGFDNEPSDEGAIFADCNAPIDEKGQPANIVLYGSNMRPDPDGEIQYPDDPAFTSLLKYKDDEEFIKEHSVINFSTVYDSPDTEYRIIACFSIDLDYEKYERGTDFEYWRYRDFDSELDFDTWAAKLREYSTYVSDTDFTENDDYLTLSAAYGDNSRFVIVARKAADTENTTDDKAPQSENDSSLLNKDHRYDLEYDEGKKQYYDVITGEYLSKEELDEYCNARNRDN